MSFDAVHNLVHISYLHLQENDEFFELISSKFLSESRYSTSIQAAAARLILSCSLTWIVQLLYLFQSYFSFFYYFIAYLLAW